MKRVAIVALLAVLAGAGCSTVSKATRKLTEAVGGLLLTPQQEQQLGNQLAAQVTQQQKPVKNQQVQTYVNEVGQRVLAAVPADQRGSFQYTFTVLDTPDTVNAFSLPGGHVFVNSGLLRVADDEAQLAAVLGHEVAHITSGHPSHQLAAQLGSETLLGLALGNNPGLLEQLGAKIAQQGYLAANSRTDETEADTKGLAYMAGAGYAPEAMPRFFQKLSQVDKSQPNLVANFFADHPAPGDRAQALQQLIAQSHFGPGRTSIIGGFSQVQADVGGPQRAA